MMLHNNQSDNPSTISEPPSPSVHGDDMYVSVSFEARGSETKELKTTQTHFFFICL